MKTGHLSKIWILVFLMMYVSSFAQEPTPLLKVNDTDPPVYVVTSDGGGTVIPVSTVGVSTEDEEEEEPTGYAVDTIVYFDFSTEPVGDWTAAEQQTFFNSYYGYAYQQDYETCDMVDMDWDGVTKRTLRIEHKTDELWHGYGIEAFIGDTVTEAYIRYRWKFGENFNAGKDGKIPGLEKQGDLHSGQIGVIRPSPDEPWEEKFGWKGGGILQSYMYDDSDVPHPNAGGYVPWGNNEDSVLLFYGTQYDLIQRVKMNTWDGTTSDDNGVFEGWVNGKKVINEDSCTNHYLGYNEDYQIDAIALGHFFGGSDTTAKPMRTCYGFITGILVYRDTANSTWGTNNFNSDSNTLEYPGAMSAQDFYVDSIIDIDTENVTSFGYPSATHFYTNYRWLIDAGENNTVSVDFETGDYTWGSMNFLVFMDGKGWGATEIDRVHGSDADLGNNDFGNGSNGTVTSTGRYMFISYVTGYDGWGNQAGGAFSAEVTFISP